MKRRFMGLSPLRASQAGDRSIPASPCGQPQRRVVESVMRSVVLPAKILAMPRASRTSALPFMHGMRQRRDPRQTPASIIRFQV